jgi:hypothetical protein
MGGRRGDGVDVEDVMTDNSTETPKTQEDIEEAVAALREACALLIEERITGIFASRTEPLSQAAYEGAVGALRGLAAAIRGRT